MRKYLPKGFTLIELLIVIAVLGILAVAVLAAINPVEQINRSRDTGSRSDAEQLIGAIDRFYASNSYFPWQTGASDTGALGVDWTTVTATLPADSGSVALLTKLGETAEGAGELKGSYLSRITATTYNALRIYKSDGTADSVYVCFAPLSKQIQKEASDRCGGASGPLPTDYPADACNSGTAVASGGCLISTGVNDCYCLP